MDSDDAPQPVRPRALGQILFFAVLAVGSAIAVWQRNGVPGLLHGLHDAFGLLVEVTPIVLGAMLVAGYARALLPHALIARWLGAELGFKGLAIAMMFGIVTPGGPFASFGLVGGMAGTGADAGACITYLTAWSMLGINRLIMWELPLLGPELALLRYTACLPMPLIAGLLSRVLVRRFGFRPLVDAA